MSAPQPPLQRRLGLGDAVVIGLGSMIGAGVFVVWSPAAAVAGDGLLMGLALALVAAYCNATSSAQLAAQYPTSGGTYVYGRERLGEWPGFLAGWGFVIGKTASVAAMALTLASYAAPHLQRPLAVAAVLVLTAINLFGVTRTARATRVIIAIVLPVLAVVVALGLTPALHPTDSTVLESVVTPGGVLQSAGLLFFAFAGYARIATMGEEVRDPTRTIPRAILIALAIAAVVYAGVGSVLLAALGPARLAASPAPLGDLGRAANAPWLVPVIAVAAGLAIAGAMLNLMTGIGRTTLAMARNGDLPRGLAVVDPRHSVPRRAELALAAAVIVLVLVGDIRTVIGFSSFGVLLYYLVANVAAYTQTADHRRFPSALQVIGAILCVTLVVTLPWRSIAIGVAVYAVGALVRVTLRAAGGRRSPQVAEEPGERPQR
ncbi:APC family permease [Mariniluteicoccus flavus]